MRKKICALTVLMFLLSGCGSLEIEFEKNGEGTFTYLIDKNEYITLHEVEDQINSSIEEANEEAGDEAVSLKEIEETDDQIEAVVEFSRLFFDSSNLFASAKDITRYDPSLLEDLTAAKGEKADPDFVKDKDLWDLPVIHLSDLDSELDTKVSVPGKILYLEGGTIDKKDLNTANGDGGDLTIVYEPKSGFGGLLAGAAAIAVLAIGLFVWTRSKKQKNSQIGGGVNHEA